MPRLTRIWPTVELVVLATLTGFGYAALHPVQRSLFRAGLAGSTPYVVPRDRVDLTAVHRELVEYLLLVGLTLLLYGWVVGRARRWSQRPGVLLLIAVPMLLQVVLVALPPTLSTDPLSYLAHGYLAADGNPYLQAAAAVQGTDYGEALRRLGWLPTAGPTPYGPLWTHVERWVVTATGTDVEVALTMIKLPALIGSWGCSLVIFRLARRLAPRWRWSALAAWHWSPLAIIECAGEGHLDGVMALLVLVGLAAAVRGRAAGGVLALGAATLVKFVPAAFALPVLVFSIRTAGRRTATTARIGIAGVAVVGAAVVSFAPWWVGSATLGGVGRVGTPTFGWTPSGLLYTALHHVWPSPTAGTATTIVLLAVLAAVAVAATAYADTPNRLIRGCGVLALATFALLPGGWPWYATLPVVILLCSPSRRVLTGCVLLVAATRSIAAFGDLQLLGAVPWALTADLDGLIGVTLPAVIGLQILWPWPRRASLECQP